MIIRYQQTAAATNNHNTIKQHQNIQANGSVVRHYDE